MSNYRFIKGETGITLMEVSSKGQNYHYYTYEIPAESMNVLLMEDLDKNRMEYTLIRDSNFSLIYELFFYDHSLVEITAPLYDSFGNLIESSYTGKAIDPEERSRVKELFEKCQKEVAEEQAVKFRDIFDCYSEDNGVSATINVDFSNMGAYYFQERYIPSDYIEVARKYFNYREKLAQVVFVKKRDAHFSSVNMKVPESMKGAVIGKGGKNKKKIEDILNARIYVI